MLLSTLFPIYYSIITLPFDTELLKALLNKPRMNFGKTFFGFAASSKKANIFNYFIYSTSQIVCPETWHILLALSLPMLSWNSWAIITSITDNKDAPVNTEFSESCFLPRVQQVLRHVSTDKHHTYLAYKLEYFWSWFIGK
jgi:hypothetical protein